MMNQHMQWQDETDCTRHSARRRGAVVRRSLATALALTLGGMALPGQAADPASLTVTAGMAVGAVYPGSDHYAALPVTDVEGQYRSDDWGTFTVGVLHGARWDMLTGDNVGLAMLLDYDRGRDERIRTLGGHDTTLMGMGDLGGTPETGLELSYRLAPFRVYVKGVQAVRERTYGGEGLGRTSHLDFGLDGGFPLSEVLTLRGNVFATWSDSGDARGHFGVTPSQAAQTGFAVYRPGAGVRQVTVETVVNYQWTPEVSVQTGVEISRLTGEATDSPLAEKTLAGMAFMSASYRF